MLVVAIPLVVVFKVAVEAVVVAVAELCLPARLMEARDHLHHRAQVAQCVLFGPVTLAHSHQLVQGTYK